MVTMLEKWKERASANLPELLNEVATSIKNVHPNCTVILFGSFARGDQHEDSDLDICVLVPEITYRRLEMEVDAASSIRDDFPLPMDLILYTYDEFEEKAKKRFLIQHDIKKEGVILGA